MPTKTKAHEAYFRRGLLPLQAWIPTRLKRRIALTAADQGKTLNDVVNEYLDMTLPTYPQFDHKTSTRKGTSNGSTR